MTAAEAVLALMWLGLTAYALFGGADFGAGFWDLFAGRAGSDTRLAAGSGTRRRALIEHSIGPVWEANHVWLIFVLVVLWTAFPGAFAAIASTLYLPLTATAFGMIARGSAFAFRKSITLGGVAGSGPALGGVAGSGPAQPSLRRFFGAAFAFSSLVTPFFLGTVAGAVASGRVPPGIAKGDIVTSWLNPTSVLGGVLAVGTCAYLAAVLLCADARREGEPDLVQWFRVRAMVTAVAVGLVALGGIAVVRGDAPQLFEGLTHRGLPLVILSAVAGLGSVVLLARRRLLLARVAAGLAVTAVVWGWAAAQYPYVLLPELTIAEAAAPRSTQLAMLVSLLVGGVLVVPSLAFLYALFQRTAAAHRGP
jgi:cytochrome bd ubiquinol oxidase subunit II